MLPCTQKKKKRNSCRVLSFSDLRCTFTTANYFLRSDDVCDWLPRRLPWAGGIRPGGAADGARVGTRVLTLPMCDLVKWQPCNQFSRLTPPPHKLTVELDPRCRNGACVVWWFFFFFKPWVILMVITQQIFHFAWSVDINCCYRPHTAPGINQYSAILIDCYPVNANAILYAQRMSSIYSHSSLNPMPFFPP